MRFFSRLFLPILLISLNFNISPAHSVYGGQEVLGSERVVALLNLRDSRFIMCSGALITSRIVLTAAHCLGKKGKFPGVIEKNHWEYWISQPGVDIMYDDISTRVQSSYVVIKDDYMNSYDPKTNDYLTQLHDIAFIFLSKPIEISTYPRIASEEEVKLLKAQRAVITHYGYGRSDKGVYTGKPKKVDLKIRPRERSYENHPLVPENYSIITDETGDSALCGGDSGGPWYAQLDGKLLIVANTVGASGCGGPGSGTGGTFGTLVHQYESLLWEKWSYFLANESEIQDWKPKAKKEREVDLKKQEERIKESKRLGQYYQELTSCHSKGIQAYLQSNLSGNWKDVAAVEDWFAINNSCYQPWTIYKASKGEMLRWRLAVPNRWEVFTDPIPEMTSEREATVAQEESKAKPEAEAKSKVEASKKLSISCIKGKTIKKVTAVNPQCPKGYKKK